MATPLHDIQQAARQVRQNVNYSKVLFVANMFLVGLLIGLLAGYFFAVRAQNTMDDRLDRIDE